MIIPKYNFDSLPLWHAFKAEYQLTDLQCHQFAQYLVLLQEYSALFNLTTIVDAENIIAYHFQDSVILSKFFDCHALTMIADIGTGAGFPGIPLKILFPHIQLTLIEVSKKKIEFLNTIIKALELDQTQVFDMDWRTFLRKTQEPIDLFVSRASLHTDELMRMFRTNCIYNDRRLVYWASKDWKITQSEEPFFQNEALYTIKNKKRRLIFFANPLKK